MAPEVPAAACHGAIQDLRVGKLRKMLDASKISRIFFERRILTRLYSTCFVLNLSQVAMFVALLFERFAPVKPSTTASITNLEALEAC